MDTAKFLFPSAVVGRLGNVSWQGLQYGPLHCLPSFVPTQLGGMGTATPVMNIASAAP